MFSQAYQEIILSVEAIIFDFDGVFTDNSVTVSQEGVESVKCWRSDGLGLSRLKELGIKLFIFSTEANPVVSVRAQKLKIGCRQNLDDKASAVKDFSKEFNIPLDKIAFVGNDINDIPALQIVGFPIAVNDAYPDILPYVKFQTEKCGGYGAVREVCDLIYNTKIIQKSSHVTQ